MMCMGVVMVGMSVGGDGISVLSPLLLCMYVFEYVYVYM